VLTINSHRLLTDLNDLGEIGRTPQNGVSRPAMSEADAAGRAWFLKRAREYKLETRRDGAGNVSAILGVDAPSAKTILIGSHLDTVPNGGKYDGALGVLAALEVLRTLKDAGHKLSVDVEAISFTDEEGEIVSMLGSRALTGQLREDDLGQARTTRQTLIDGMQRLDITQRSILSAQRDAEDYIAFVEVHIEQGERLNQSGHQIGVVSSIVGIRSFWLHFSGEAAHAGTMPMDKRADALWGATAFLQQARQHVMKHFSPGVMNCGRINVEPGAFNIVPARVTLALEFRHGKEHQLDEMQTVLLEMAAQIAEQFSLGLEVEAASHVISAEMDAGVMAAIESASDALELRHQRLISFAGHDTQTLSRFVPSAMFFVPCVDGISHNPREMAHPEDVVNAANVLLHTVLALAGG
jgi:N-carbamoyl-L-amino-acid hydrolase